VPTGVRHDLRGFTGAGYERGRGAAWQIAWQLVSGLIVVRWWCPPSMRAAILRAFGATIGDGAVIRHRVRIHWPWKLTIGAGSWIGEGAWLLNLEPITIGADVCISQEVLLCTGSHDRRSRTFEYDNAPIVVDDGAWIAARATVLRGTRIGADSVIGATALISGDVAAGETVLAPRATRRPTT
jgi:Acetyltransferase (isoleucine patch superfamily)